MARIAKTVDQDGTFTVYFGPKLSRGGSPVQPPTKVQAKRNLGQSPGLKSPEDHHEGRNVKAPTNDSAAAMFQDGFASWF